MWHATKVAGSGAQKPLVGLTINRCLCVVPNQTTPAPEASTLRPSADARAAVSEAEPVGYPLAWLLPLSPPPLPLLLPPPVAAKVITISQPRQPASCRFLSENVVQSAGLLLSSKSASSSSSSFCKLSPAIRTERTALLALTLNCQHQVADHATRGASQQFKCDFKCL